MSRKVSRASIIGSIIRKDAKEYSRDKFFTLITLMGLVAYVVMFWVFPSSVNETIKIGVHQTGMDKPLQELTESEDNGIKIIEFDTSDDLKTALGMTKKKADESIVVGMDFPDNFIANIAKGEKTRVKLYVDSSVPEEIRHAMSSWVRELAYAMTGSVLPVKMPDEKTIILGEDRTGDQVSMREKMRPLFAFFMLIMEMFALTSLVASEIQSRTVTAVIVTPARTSDFLAAKGILGTMLAFAETVLLMLLIRGFGNGPLILLLTLLLGAMLVTGLGLIAGASGKDFINMIFYSMVFLIPLIIPPIALLFPGTASFWVKVLPSYGLVQAIVGVSAYGDGWSETMPYLASLAAWCAVSFGIGWYTLKR